MEQNNLFKTFSLEEELSNAKIIKEEECFLCETPNETTFSFIDFKVKRFEKVTEQLEGKNGPYIVHLAVIVSKEEYKQKHVKKEFVNEEKKVELIQ